VRLALQRGERGLGVEVDEDVPARVDRLGPLGGAPQRDAGRGGQVGLLLDAAGVGQDGPSVVEEGGELEVADGSAEADGRCLLQAPELAGRQAEFLDRL